MDKEPNFRSQLPLRYYATASSVVLSQTSQNMMWINWDFAH